MPWGRIDDRFYRHAKVAELEEDLRKGCVALYWLAVSWCNDELTDGRVPLGAVRLLGGDKAEADELVRVGLWERDGKAYRVHDFLEFNQSAVHVRDVRETRSQVGRIRAAYRWDASTHASEDASTHASGDGPVSRLPSPVTSTPSPAAQRARAPDDAVEAYFAVTGRTPTSGALGWLNELATDHGEAALCVALRTTEYAPPKTYISRVANALTTITVGSPEGKVAPRTEEEWMAAQAEKRRPSLELADIAQAVAGARGATA
jgi:hypothetical protein